MSSKPIENISKVDLATLPTSDHLTLLFKNGKSSEVDLSMLPTSEHLTLLFKHGKSTTLLSVLPTQPFGEIKDMLLAALRSRNISTLPGSTTRLPKDPNQIQLGVLRDRKDAGKGWVPLVVKEQQLNGKAGKTKAGSKSDGPNEGPAAAGLTDGSWLAYRVAAQLEDEDDDMMLEMDDVGWNVVLPSYDDEEMES